MALDGFGSDSGFLDGQESSPPTTGAPRGATGPSTPQTATPEPSARDEGTVHRADDTSHDTRSPAPTENEASVDPDTSTHSPENNQPDSSWQEAERQARAAAETYYREVVARNWEYTYDHLDSQTRSAYTEQEWFAKNEYLANTGAVTYTVESVAMDPSAPETIANVTVVLTGTSGSTNVRNTFWVYQDGVWKHRFGAGEFELLADAPSGSASAQ